MKILQSTFCVLGILMLSACSNTWEGLKRDATDADSWAHHQPSELGQMVGPAPTGYTGLGTGSSVLKPPGMEQTALTEPEDLFEVASTPEVFEEEEEAAPEPVAETSSGSADYEDGAVSVFSIDDDSSVYKPSDYALPSDRSDPDLTGDLAERVYFAYGSANVGTGDRARLRKLAAKLNRKETPYKISVVGHASKRVDHVKDPLRKKLINFEMAQKRAHEVTQALRHAGAEPDWVIAVSRGDEMPNPDRGQRTQEAADRRAEVYVDNE